MKALVRWQRRKVLLPPPSLVPAETVETDDEGVGSVPRVIRLVDVLGPRVWLDVQRHCSNFGDVEADNDVLRAESNIGSPHIPLVQDPQAVHRYPIIIRFKSAATRSPLTGDGIRC